MSSKLTVDKLNRLDQREFVRAFGGLFEHSSWLADRVWERRPFETVDELAHAFEAEVLAGSQEDKLALIRAYPDLAGKEAAEGTLTSDSVNEHASAGLDRLTADEHASLTRLNSEYRGKFGFPLVFCTREQTKQSILRQGELRLSHSRTQEVQTALGEIFKIARLRLIDRVHATEQVTP
jgi:OHCU decarboxylase